MRAPAVALVALATAVIPASAAASPHAPSAPPLLHRSSATPQTDAGEGGVVGSDASASAPPSGGDPLVENGLGSPLCGASGELSAESQRNCETSGFEASGAPTGNYALDVHIDTGLLGLTLPTVLQDYLIEPVWMGLVWVVHTLVVALEWCFTLDLLDSSAIESLQRALRATQTSFTGPWLKLALALASMAAAYNGLVRRRVAETLGQAALMLAMIAGAMWVIADPTGTVGALGRWVDEASEGTLGAVVQGTPAHAPRTLAQSMGGLFAGVVGAPWCYLEFGNVSWCEDPVRLEPRLRAAGIAIVTHAHIAHCPNDEGLQSICQMLESEQPRAPAGGTAQMLMRAARTNGELFLALPANQRERNSIDDPHSLLSVLCGGSESATECRGPSAAEAEFRTASGTDPRLAGLLLIAIGALGAILLLGFIVLHLLGAEILSLLYLLLAPAAAIAPALGESGRAAFRTWGTRLVGAICSKLLFSFLLGAVLLMTRTLMDFDVLGWWSRWLLVSILWWGVYRQRHQVLSYIGGAHRGQSERHRSLTQHMKRQLEGRSGVMATWRTAQWARGKLSGPAPSIERRRTLERIGRRRAQTAADEQVTRMLEHEHAAAREHAAAAPEIQSELSVKRAQLQRVQSERERALASGDTRRAVRLDVRARRIEGEVERGQLALNEARRTAAEGERAQRRTGRAYTANQTRERGRLLDDQAALPVAPRGLGARGGSVAGKRLGSDGARIGSTAQGDGRRDYAALASLVGYGREQYERLDPRTRREARLEIDRELALRRELSDAADAVVAAAERAPGRRERRRAGKDFDRALEERLRQGGHAPPRSIARGRTSEGASRGGRPHDVRRHDPRHHPGVGGAGGASGLQSPVMRDAHEVAQRRKRQLGS